MKRIKIWNETPSDKQLDEISQALGNGNLVILPTDTLYAIVCDALNPKAIERLCRLKGINPEKTNLSIICKDISMASEYARFGNEEFQLLKKYAPGPFTFLFKAASKLPKAFKGRKTVGIRIPDCSLDRDIAARLDRPLLTTSINFSDEDYARNPDLMAETYNDKVKMFVEGEEGELEPSTIVDCTDGEIKVIRQGKGSL
ncbi:MAG: threonylcarbamoyl-AMP synthase [Muribaculaceae bacterium]|nr:threonylcarbamoyl-AMP synthase [Muribaculaceae bacterium]